jgi:hypothetical protein
MATHIYYTSAAGKARLLARTICKDHDSELLRVWRLSTEMARMPNTQQSSSSHCLMITVYGRIFWMIWGPFLNLPLINQLDNTPKHQQWKPKQHP